MFFFPHTGVGTRKTSYPCACRLRHHLSYFLPYCNQAAREWTSEELRSKPTEFKVSKGLVFDLRPTRLSRCILYTIPWYLSTGTKLPPVFGGRELLTILSANKILNLKPTGKNLRDNVTIIGGSYIAR
ncbi:MAG: hypothetical protein DRQ57_18700 [Gammaproteobacteria bacterium]|nr:MAG: hypothetical protein DRQ57_18700 [Gammaproteobacteria bacterium]